jgi:putative addiction module component (TIGR02574 family)
VETRLRLAEFDSQGWIADEEPLTTHEKTLLEARLAAYTKDPDAGDTWEEVEDRILTRLTAR